jgi:hypothetical protein
MGILYEYYYIAAEKVFTVIDFGEVAALLDGPCV